MMTTQEVPSSAIHEEFAPAESWDAIAAGYDEFVAPGEKTLAAEALRLVDLKAGEHFLDIASGPGGLSLPAARLGATVVATDWSHEMIARFETRVRDEGLAGAEGRVMDAHALELGDDTFDVSGSLFGVMLVPNQATALREMVRVTKTDGRVLLIAYGPPAGFEALQFFIAALTAVVPEFEGLPEDPAPLEFQVSDPAVMRARLSAAGLRDVRVDTSNLERLEFDSGIAAWNWMLNSNPIVGMILSDVTDEQQATVREVLHGMIRERAGGSARAVLTAPLTIGWGRKSGSA